ncbi:MAG: NifB/NifX family molybdenum-iron cluster-binding protein [Candidatus Bathyarchaeia archaeon]
MKIRIAIATNGKEKLEDNVSQVFGRANNFTIIDVEDGETRKIEVVQNPAVSYEHGAGPIVVKKLAESKVNVAVAPDFGPGASTLLEHHNIIMITAKAGTKVREALEEALKKLKGK